jgi:hypothetical protein
VRGDGVQHHLERGPLERPEVTGGDVEERRAVGALPGAHRHEPGGPGGIEHVLLQHRAGGDDADDLPPHDARPRAGRLDLLADGDLVAGLEQPCQISAGGVKRDAAHRHPVGALAPCGEGDAEQLRGADGVLEEELVEVTEPEEEEGLPARAFASRYWRIIGVTGASAGCSSSTTVRAVAAALRSTARHLSSPVAPRRPGIRW